MTVPNSSSAANLQVNQADPHTTAIIAALIAELQRSPTLSDFSPQAAAEFLNQSGEASRAIGIDSIRLARADNTDYVSEKHVRQAAARLVPRKTSRWPEFSLVVGGIISGAALQEFVDKAILADSNPTKSQVATIFILSLLGIGLLVAGFYRKRT